MNTLPDTATLSQQLSALLTNGSQQGQFEILSRKPFINTSTFPVEIITCRLNNGRIINLFCKYLAGTIRNDFEHRGGVKYESRIYDEVLKNTALSQPKYYGSCFFVDDNETLLALEYLEDSIRLAHAEDSDVLLKDAAYWIGSLHKFWENKVPDFVTVYDESYYSKWADEVKKVVPEFKKEYPWLIDVHDFFRDNIKFLIRSPQTTIHGEYYPKNILVKNNLIYPIDWESVASAHGEIDLASLIEGWEEPVAHNSINAYKIARGITEDEANDFENRLYLSQIYFHFRWMTEFVGKWVNKPGEFALLYDVAKKAGCI
jgi:hypothetical protein